MGPRGSKTATNHMRQQCTTVSTHTPQSIGVSHAEAQRGGGNAATLKKYRWLPNYYRNALTSPSDFLMAVAGCLLQCVFM